MRERSLEQERGARRAAEFLAPLDVELELDDVAVLDDVLLPLLAVLAEGLEVGHRGLAAAVLLEVVEGAELGLDEAALEVGVDGAGGLGREGAVVDVPGADLLLAGGEEVDEVELLVAALDDAGEDGLGAAGGLDDGLDGVDAAGLLRVEELLLVLDGEGDGRAAAVLLDPLGDLREPLALLGDEVLLREVDEVDDRLRRDERGRDDLEPAAARRLNSGRRGHAARTPGARSAISASVKPAMNAGLSSAKCERILSRALL